MSYSTSDPQRALVHRIGSSLAPQTSRLSSIFDGLQKGQLPRAGGANAPAKKAQKKQQGGGGGGGRPQQQQQRGGGGGGGGRGQQQQQQQRKTVKGATTGAAVQGGRKGKKDQPKAAAAGGRRGAAGSGGEAKKKGFQPKAKKEKEATPSKETLDSAMDGASGGLHFLRSAPPSLFPISFLYPLAPLPHLSHSTPHPAAYRSAASEGGGGGGGGEAPPA